MDSRALWSIDSEINGSKQSAIDMLHASEISTGHETDSCEALSKRTHVAIYSTDEKVKQNL